MTEPYGTVHIGKSFEFLEEADVILSVGTENLKNFRPVGWSGPNGTYKYIYDDDGNLIGSEKVEPHPCAAECFYGTCGYGPSHMACGGCCGCRGGCEVDHELEMENEQ
jgi:hypothetical protein